MNHSGHGMMVHNGHQMHGMESSTGYVDHGAHMNHPEVKMDDMTHDHGTGDMDVSTGHSMSMMYFHFGVSETILFETWNVSTVGGLIGSMIGIFFMAALYEGLKYYREYLFIKTHRGLQYQPVSIPSEKTMAGDESQIIQPPSMLSWSHGFQTFLHVIQMVLSYFLMLIFMTFNVWLCLAVVMGAAVGFFLFGWKKSVIVDVTEHCH